MNRRLLLPALICPALLAAACNSATLSRRSDVEGTYTFADQGDVLGKEWAARATLDLYDDGQFRLRIRARFEDQEESETARGSYHVRNGRVVIQDDDGDLDRHELEIRGDTLVPRLNWPTRTALRALGVNLRFVKE